jgi:hypothetical protein
MTEWTWIWQEVNKNLFLTFFFAGAGICFISISIGIRLSTIANRFENLSITMLRFEISNLIVHIGMAIGVFVAAVGPILEKPHMKNAVQLFGSLFGIGILFLIMAYWNLKKISQLQYELKYGSDYESENSDNILEHAAHNSSPEVFQNIPSPPPTN